MGPTCCWWRFPIATKHSHFSGLAVGRPHSIWIAQSSPSPRRISRGSWRTWRQWASPCYQSKHGISDFFITTHWFGGFVMFLQLHWLNIHYHCFWNWDMVSSTYHIPQCMWSQLAPRMLRASLAQRCQIWGLIRWCFYPEVWWCSKLRISCFGMFWSGFIFKFFWFHAKKGGFIWFYIYTYIYNIVSARDKNFESSGSKQSQGWCNGKPTCLKYHPESIKVKGIQKLRKHIPSTKIILARLEQHIQLTVLIW